MSEKYKNLKVKELQGKAKKEKKRLFSYLQPFRIITEA